MDEIWSGWLVKSPPEKKTQGQWFGRIFQSKWRRRYFVLHQPSAKASLPGSHVLDYFDQDNPQKRKKLGTIDLDQCEEILSTLDSAHYKHLFALRTKHKSRDRTYFLAAGSEVDMNKWVQCLCNVCGFKPDPTEEALQSGNLSEEWPSQAAPHQPVQGSPARSVSSMLDHSIQNSESSSSHGQSTPLRRLSNQESYIPLDECYSDRASDRSLKKSNTSPLDQVPPAPGRRHRGSTDSIPDMIAPAPPVKTGEKIELVGDPLQTYDAPSKSYVNMDMFDQDDGTYKVPPRRQLEPDPNQGFYQVPPSKHMEFKDSTDGWQQLPPNGNLRTEAEYDVPPSRSASRKDSQRDSGSSSGSRGSHRPDMSGLSPDSFYDSPRKHSSESVDAVASHMRQTSIPKSVIYTNQETYDVPPARKGQVLETVPPPPRPAKVQGPQMAYQNIPTNSKARGDQTYDTPRKPSDAEILSMSPPPPQPHNSRGHGYVNSMSGYPPQHESMYMPMQGGGPYDQQLYLPMSEHPLLYTDMTGIYTTPPSNKPLSSRSASATPPRLQRLQPSMTPAEGEGEDSYIIVQTHRTRSFKRQVNESSIPLPTRRPTVIHSSSSDEDSDSADSKASHDNPHIKAAKAADPGTGHKTNLNSTPPPPHRSGEIQYLDLYHEENSDNEKASGSTFSTVPPPGNITPTDYKEIDFVKTKALSDTRKDLESKRKSSERSVDE